MKSLRKLSVGLVAGLLMVALTGCGKDDDELVLVTTEAITTEEATAIDAMAQDTTDEVTTEEVIATEEASEKEKNITIQDIYEANKGDSILAGGLSYGLNTIYYSGDTEVYSEYKYLGFDSSGMYAQVYEDSDGTVQLLDTANYYWYLIEDNELKVLLYPELYVSAAIIESNHNAMIFGLAEDDMNSHIIQDIYRREGAVVIESLYCDATGTNYLVEYVLGDNFQISEYTCYDLDGNKVSYSWVTPGATYTNPDIITEAKAMEEAYRTVTVKYVDGEELDMPYYTPVDCPIELSTVEYTAYSDQACTLEWTEVEPNEDGVYTDVTIYMKKITKEGE